MIHLSSFSKNKKTGPIPVSTSGKQTCPDSCVLKGNGCYAEGGPINIHWQKVSGGERGISWNEFLNSIRKLRKGTLWRHNQAGDLQGANELINFDRLKELVEANKGRRGFTYTHYPVLWQDVDSEIYPNPIDQAAIAQGNRIRIKYANENGFTINLSANGPKHAEELKALGIAPVVSVVNEDFQTNDKIVVCPAVTRDDANCFNCQLCQRQHSKIIGFPVHGVRKRTAKQTII